MKKTTFNLVEQPWIPCVDHEGKRRQLGLRDLLIQAHELRELDHQNPLTTAALIRVLLAAVHRIVGGPRRESDWIGVYKSGSFSPESINVYLDRHLDRFDLFSSDAPFYQTAGLAILDAGGASSPVSITSIMLDRASGNNKTVFDHTTDETSVSLTPAEAALSLITAQMFALGGLNKKTTNRFGYQQSYLNATMVNGIFVMLSGQSIFETLMLNLLICNEGEPMPSQPDDCPVWERETVAGFTATTPRGYLDFLTCCCRHILLVPEGTEDDIRVSRVHIAQGEAFPGVRNPGFISKQNKDGEWYHPQLDPDRLVWRDSTALFAFEEGNDRRPMAFTEVSSRLRAGVVSRPARYICTAIALANDKANPLAWRKESLSVPVGLLEKEGLVPVLKEGMRRAEKGGQLLDAAVKLFMRTALPPNSKDVNDKAAATGALRVYWDRMERPFHVFLEKIEDEDAALNAWTETIASTARLTLQTAVRQRYADSVRSLRAWAAASDQLNARISELATDKGGGKK